MRIEHLQIKNYKSFADSGRIRLQRGFNFFIGKNNSGKSALLSVLQFQLNAQPHRTARTAPTPSAPLSSESRGTVGFVVSGREFSQLTLNREAIGIPPVDAAPRDVLARIIEPDRETQFEIAFTGDFVHNYDVNWNLGYQLNAQHVRSLYMHQNDAGTWMDSGRQDLGGGGGVPDAHIGLWLGRRLRENTFVFAAERMNIGTSAFGSQSRLAPNASNLPEALNTLQGDPSRFAKYNELLRRIFPQIQQVTVLPQGNNAVRIFVWDQGRERQDLAVPLDQSGTGLSQVLAMLYVLVTADFPKVIAIDEPASFLHPGAVRALFQILEEHGMHQYVIASHSAEVISAVSSGAVHLVQKGESGSTTLTPLDAADARQMRTALQELGTRLSDVFGADRILWVEGATEEKAFSIILRDVLGSRSTSTAVIGVVNTGDFSSRHIDFPIAVYSRLSRGNALVPPAIGFIFDRELRSAEKIREIEEKSSKAISFIGRRMYENYLLDSEAIASVLNEALAKVGLSPVATEKVAEFLNAAERNPDYLGRREGEFRTEADAAAVLEDLFWKLSEKRLTYEKVEHGIALTRWLLSNRREALTEVIDLLRRKVEMAH